MNPKPETLTVILADQSEIEVDQTWLINHSKMVKVMLSQKGMKKATELSLPDLPSSSYFNWMKLTVEGNLNWLLDQKLESLDSIYSSLWKTLNYLDISVQINWELLNTQAESLKAIFLLDLIIQPDQNFGLSKLLNQLDSKTFLRWEETFHSIVSNLGPIKQELINLRLIFDRIFQASSLNLEIQPYHNQLDLNLNFVSQLKKMAGSAWPWTGNLNNWPEGLILAGGSVITCQMNRDLSLIEPSEDLDFWVYGSTEEERKARFKIALEWLTDRVKDQIILSVNHSVVSLILPGDQVRMIQLIYTQETNPEAVVNRFDLGYLKCYFDGRHLLGSDESRMAFELGIIDFDGNQIKPTRLYKLLRHGFNWSDSIQKQLADRFKLEDNSIQEKLNEYDDVQQSKQKYIHLPTGIDRERAKYLVDLILGGQFITSSIDQLYQNMTYQPFLIEHYTGNLEMIGDSITESGLLLDFSQPRVIYQAQIDRIVPNLKIKPLKELYFSDASGRNQFWYKIGLSDPITIRFRDLTVESGGFRDKRNRVILDSYIVLPIDRFDQLTTDINQLYHRIFTQTMIDNEKLKYKEILKIPSYNEKDWEFFTKKFINPSYENHLTRENIINYLLGFNLTNPIVIQGDISQRMIVDIDLTFIGWCYLKTGMLFPQKKVKRLIVRQNLSPLLKPGKERIGQPWKNPN